MGECKVKHLDWYAGESCAVNLSDILFRQKSCQLWEEKKGEGEGEAVKYEFNVTLQEKKKDLGFDSCLQLGPKQMCGYAKHLPKRSGRQEVGAETHNPSVHIHHEMAGGWREPGIWLYPIK